MDLKTDRYHVAQRSLRHAMTMAALVITIGCTQTHNDDVNLVDASYGQFATSIGTNLIDPKGGKSISCSCRSTIDSYNLLLKVQLAREDFEVLLDWRESQHSNGEWRRSGFEIRKTDTGDVFYVDLLRQSFPSQWRDGFEMPSWLEGLHATGQVQLISWTIEPSREHDWLSGETWLYSFDTSTLVVWKWSNQHASLRDGGSTPQ